MKYILLVILFFLSCSEINKDILIETVKIGKDAYREAKEKENIPTVKENLTVEPSLEPIPILEPQIKPVNDFLIPDNCNNAPKNIASNDGFKCMGSATRNNTVVCLLPYLFTWKPFKSITDHHNNTFSCNKNDEHFDEVFLIQKNNKKINLKYAGCHNYVATQNGKIGRQHYRDESIKWDSIKNKVNYIVMIKNNKKTCLKF
jgi:hypothetical protein